MYRCCVLYVVFFFFKQKTAYEMRISDWSSDVCSSDLAGRQLGVEQGRRQTAGQAQEDFEVLAAGMQHLDHRLVFEQRGEWRPVMDQQRIDQVGQIGRASCRERVCQYV